MKTTTEALPLVSLPQPAPAPAVLSMKDRRQKMRNILRAILEYPDLLPGLKATDLVGMFGIARSTAYQLLRRARNLHVKHADSGVEQGRGT